MSKTIPQQSLFLLRQLLASTGWTESTQDVFLAGQLLVETLPETDPTDWAKPDHELRAMPRAELDAYAARDKAHCDKPVALTLNARQLACIDKCLTKQGHILPAGKYSFELLAAFTTLGKED